MDISDCCTRRRGAVLLQAFLHQIWTTDPLKIRDAVDVDVELVDGDMETADPLVFGFRCLHDWPAQRAMVVSKVMGEAVARHATLPRVLQARKAGSLLPA